MTRYLRWPLILAALSAVMLIAPPSGANMPNEDYAAIIAFASDFSGNDEAIVRRVRDMAENPPTDMETIGFYSGEDYPPRDRLYLATVSLLDDQQKLHSVEDKYTAEIFMIWQDEGIISEKDLPPAAKAVFGPLIIGEQPAGDVEDYRAVVWEKYAQATRELEQHMADRGRILLSIDATEGDTMLFALVSPDIAGRWRDKALSDHEGYRAGVRSPMWDRFWVHLTYSTRGMMADEDREGYPPGVVERVESIPMVGE